MLVGSHSSMAFGSHGSETKSQDSINSTVSFEGFIFKHSVVLQSNYLVFVLEMTVSIWTELIVAEPSAAFAATSRPAVAVDTGCIE